MRVRAGLFASIATVALTLLACSSSAGSPGAKPAGAAATKTLSWGYESEFSSYNINTSAGGTSANMVVLNPVLSGFHQFQPDGSSKPNLDFGRVDKISDSPLTVRYSINPRAVWSDGAPIDCDDFMLAWLANSGVTGGQGFSAGKQPGYADQNRPVCTAGGREVVVTYRRPFSDWALSYGPTTIMPAHVVEREAHLGQSFIELAMTPTAPGLAAAVTFYEHGWNFAPGELKKELTPSSGPYQLDSWSAGQSLTLSANPRWWGTRPKIDRIVIRYIAGSAQPQALANGEIQAMDPQPQADTVQQLKALGNKIRFSTHDALKYEHLDFNFAGSFKDPTLRQAFAKCVPRQQIVDDLIKPQNPNAQIMESRFVYPFQPGYDRVAARAGGRDYDTVDIAGARALLAGRRPVVRIGWSKSPTQINQRRANTIILIRQSCRQAGFTVLDVGTPTFFDKEIFSTGYDVALFSWGQFGSVAGLAGQFVTGGGDNPYHYSDRQVDAIFDQLGSELDHGKQAPLVEQLDTVLWRDLATIPLFALPAVLATSPNVAGVQYNATPVDLTWNAADWDLR